MKKKIPTYCDQCYNGPDIFNAIVEDGIIHSVEPNTDCEEFSPAGGRICVKAYGLVQKVYNPNRIKAPLVRTNPRKGKDEDPGWKEISWEKAFELMADKMMETRAKGMTDEEGFPRLAVIMGQAASPAAYAGTLPAFFSAWGPIDYTIGGGEGIKCYHSEHLFCEYWHRCFIGAADTPRSELVVAFGHNTNASGGASGVRRHAQAREREYKRIQVEPHISVSAATSNEWVPVKVKTDAALMYGLIHVLLHEYDREKSCDIDFLKKRTNSPYLVGPNGFFMREPKSGNPYIWDPVQDRPKVYNALDIEDYALEGTFTVSGLEKGADDEVFKHESVECRSAFQMLLDFMKEYTPEWASEICDIPASRIRELAGEILSHAHLGETIEISGEEMPYRPVAFLLGKTVNNGPGGYQTCWARTMLAMLLGALEVPGGTIGASQRLNKPHHDRWSSIWPGNDGFMRSFLNPTDKKNWPAEPKSRAMYTELLPLVLNTGWSPFLSSVPFSWVTMGSDWGKMKRTTYPDIVLLYRANPGVSMYFTKLIEEKMEQFPFFICIGYTHDETNHYADLILPDHTDLEGLQLFRVGPSVHSESFWKEYGFALRQPAVPPVVDSIDLTELATEVSERCGILKDYNDAINAGLLLGIRLKGKGFNHELLPDKKYSSEELWDRLCKSATMVLSDGNVEHDLDWYKEHGYYTVPYPNVRNFLHPAMKRWGLRYEIPYQENIKRIGLELRNRLKEQGIDWWDHQLKEYSALPECEDYSKLWDDMCRLEGANPDEFNFWLVNTRSMQYAWGSNASIPLMAEVAKNVTGFKGAVLNAGVAGKLGIGEDDIIIIESPHARVRARAVLREGVRPDTIVFTGQFGHWKTPFARDLDLPNLNQLTAPEQMMTIMDAGGSLADVVKVKIRREK